MRQVAKRLKDGRLELIEMPEPSPGAMEVAVRVDASIVSAGTERATLEVAEKGLLAKARARPDQARQVIERARREGIRSTATLVRQRLEEWSPLGYSAAGEVIEVGAEVRSLAPGDRVAIAGEGAAHGDVAVVPQLLCSRVPAGVEPEQAAFATLGAIALNGLRRAEAEVGERVAVIGLGLIGQLAVRCARAAGCEVLGVDVRAERADLSRGAGASAVTRAELAEGSRWEGWADAVLICAAARSDDPVKLAAALSRDGGTVVVVGDVLMELPRTPFYEKELDLRLARSYGPGRYDPDYEIHGHDYPIGHVRWTAQRNMEAFLGLVAEGRVAPAELITHRYTLDDVAEAFETLRSEDSAVAIVLRPADAPRTDAAPMGAPRPLAAAARSRARGLRFGLIGPGAFATATILPGLRRAGFEPVAVASASGLSAESARRRFGFRSVHGDWRELIARDDIDLVVVATRHDTHAELAAAALTEGKAVYVEKPLALDGEELAMVARAASASDAPLIVGFNRRHSELAAAVRELPAPRSMTYRVNAGPLDRGHWANDLARGGGRLQGEGCHFIDFLRDQAGCDPMTVYATGYPSDPALAREAIDNFTVQLAFADGSVGVLQYAADAPPGPGKERFECSAPGAFAVIDDFRSATVWRGRQRRRLRVRGQDKGFEAQYRLLAEILGGSREPPPFEGFLLTTLATHAAARSLRTGRPEEVVGVEAERPAGELAPSGPSLER